MRVAGGNPGLFPPGAGVPLGLAVPVLAASLMLPWQGQWICCAATIIVLGVPHGALDVEIGRTLLRDRLGRLWFPSFAVPYLALVAVVLVAWRLAPESTLAAFLAVSVWHFGSEEAPGGGLPTFVRGGLPVALPVLIQPGATAQVLSAISGVPFTAPPAWLLWGSVVWLPLAIAWGCNTLIAGPRRALLPSLTVSAGFVALPPFTAFALYFIGVHAPLHMAALVRHPTRALRVRDTASAWRCSMPITGLTVLIGACLWPLSPGEPAVRLVCVTLQLLAALTLPHLLLDAWLAGRERARPTASAPTVRPPMREMLARS